VIAVVMEKAPRLQGRVVVVVAGTVVLAGTVVVAGTVVLVVAGTVVTGTEAVVREMEVE
jgi:hypothetical protein